jgi:ADP-ribosyl-[dinitrogen reductase] hydrolase
MHDACQANPKDVQDHKPQRDVRKRPVLPSRNLPIVRAAQNWYSGAYLLETVPTVLHILMRHAADPEEAITRAVNDTKDNDTIGCIVGAAVGALHGDSALPERWRNDLLGRAIANGEDGEIFELVEATVQRISP